MKVGDFWQYTVVERLKKEDHKKEKDPRQKYIPKMLPEINCSQQMWPEEVKTLGLKH